MSFSPQGNPFADWLKQQNPDYHREIEGDFDVDAALNAIQSHEGGSLGVKNPRTSATGYYQVMPKNIPIWTKEILGRAYTPEEFAADEDAQHKVARAKVKEYAAKHNGDMREVLHDWYGHGTPAEGETSVPDYIERGLKTYNATIDKMDTYEKSMYEKYQAAQQAQSGMTPEQLAEIQAQQRAMGGNPDITGVPEKKGATDPNAPTGLEKTADWIGGGIRDTVEAGGTVLDAVGSAIGLPTKGQQEEAKVSGRSATGRDALPFGFEKKDGKIVAKKGLMERLSPGQATLDQANQWAREVLKKRLGNPTDEEWKMLQEKFGPGVGSIDADEEGWKNYQKSAAEYNQAIFDAGRQALGMKGVPLTKDGHTDKEMAAIWAAGEAQTHRKPIGPNDVGLPLESVASVKKALDDYRLNNRGLMTKEQATESTKAFTTMLEQKAQESEKKAAELEAVGRTPEAEWYKKDAYDSRMQINQKVSGLQDYLDGLAFENVKDQLWNQHVQQYGKEADTPQERAKWEAGIHGNLTDLLSEVFKDSGPTYDMINYLTANRAVGEKGWADVAARNVAKPIAAFAREANLGIFNAPVTIINPDTGQPMEFDAGWLGDVPTSASDFAAERKQNQFERKGGKAGDAYSLASHGSEFTAGLAGTFAGFEGLTEGARALAGISDAAATRLAAAGVSEGTTKLATGYARGLETFGKAIASSPEFAAVVESAGIGVTTTAGRETVKVLRGIQTPQEAFVNTLKESPLEAANLLILLGPGKALSEIAGANLNEMKLGENVKNLVAEAGRTARVAAEAGASGEGAAALKEFLNLRKDLANSLKDIKLGDIRDRGLLLGGAAGMAAGQAGIRAVLSNQKPTYEQAATDIAFNLLGAKARPEGVVGVNEGIKRGVENNPIFGPAADGERGYGFGTKSGGEMAGDSAAKTREVMAQLGPENVKQGYTLLRDRQKKIIEAFDLRNDISPDQFRQRIRELHPEASPEQADGLSDALLDPKTTRKDLEAKLTDYENKIKGAEEAMKQPDVMEARSNVLLDQAAKKDAETQELVKHVLNQGEELAKQMEATAQEPMQNISALGERLQRDNERLARGQKTYQDAMLLAKNAADTARQADETIKFLLAKQQTAIKNINDRYVADMIDGVPADGQMPPAVRERLDQMTAGLNQATLESAEAKKMADDYNNRLAEIQKELIDPAQKEIENTQKQLEEEGKKVEDVMANADKIREEHKKKAKEIQDAGDKAAQALEDEATKGYKDADARREEIAKEALKKKEEEGNKLAGARDKDERKADRKAESEKKAEEKKSKKASAKKEAGKADVNTKDGSKADEKKGESAKPANAQASRGKAAEEAGAAPVAADDAVRKGEVREGDAIWTNKDGDQPIRVTGKPEAGPDGRMYVPIEGSNTRVPVDEIKQPVKVEDTGALGGRAGVKADILKQLHVWNDSPNLNFAKTGERGEHVEKGGKRKKHSEEELDAFAESMTNMVEHVRKTLNNLVSHEDVGKFMFGPSGFKGEFMRFGGEKYVPHFTDTGVGLPGSGEGFGRKADAQAFMEGYLKEHPEDADRVKIAQAGGSAPSDKTYNHIFKQGSLATTMHEFGHRIRPLLKGEDQVLINNAFNRGSKDWDVAAEERFVKAMEFVNFTGELPDGVDPKVAGIIKNVSKVMRQLYAETSRFDDYGIAPDVKAFFQEMNHGIVRTVAEPERVRQILVAGGRPIIVNSPPPANPGLSVIASANMNDPVIEGIDTTSLHATFDPNSKFTRLIKELPGLAAGLRDVSLGYGPVGVDTGFGRLNLTDPVAVRSAKEALRAKWNEAYKALLEQNEHLDPDTSKRILYWGLYNILRTPDDATVNFVLTSLEKTGAFKFATSAKAFEIGRRLSMGHAWLDAAERELIRRGMDPVVHFGSPRQFSRNVMFDLGGSTKQTDTPEFKKWFGDSKIKDEKGEPIRLYHGTTHSFDKFDPKKGHVESAIGQAIYLTTSPEDAGKNYAGFGPDLKNRIELTSDRLIDDFFNDPDGFKKFHGLPEDFSGTPEEFDKIAKKRLHGGAEGVLPVYAAVKNPAIFDWGTRFGGQTYLDPINKYIEKTDEYVENPRSSGYRFYQAFKDRLESNEFISDHERQELLATISDGLSNEEPIGTIHAQYKFNEANSSLINEGGEIVSDDIFRQALQDIGFDGVVMNASLRFPSMVPKNEDVEHIVAFKPTQIKSAIGNRGTFNPRSPNILYDLGAEGGNGPNFSSADDGAVHLTKDGEIYELDKENQAKLLNIIENQGKNKMSTLPKSDRIVPYGFKMDKATGWDGINREAYDDTVKLLAQKADPNQHWAVKRKEAMTIEAGVKKHAETFKNMKTTTEPRHFAFIGPDGTGYARMPGDVTHRQTWSTAAGYKYDKYNYTSGKEADKQMSQFMDDTSTIRVADVGKSGVYLEVKKPLTDAQIKTLADKFFGLNISLSLTKRTFDFASVHVVDADIKSLKAANKPLAKAVKMENPYAVVDTVTLYGNNAKKVMYDMGGQPREKRQKPSDEEIARLREQKLAARREYVDSRPDMNPEEARTGFYSEVERAIPKVFGKLDEMPANKVREGIANSGAKKEELRDLGLDRLFKERGDKPVTRAEVETLMKANKLVVEENRLGGGPNVTQEQLAYRARITELQGLESDAKIPALRAVLKAYDFGNNAAAEEAGRATSILNSLIDGEPNTDAERKLLETPEVQAYKKTRELRQNTEQKYRESDPAYALQKAQEALADYNERADSNMAFRQGVFDEIKKELPNLSHYETAQLIDMASSKIDLQPDPAEGTRSDLIKKIRGLHSFKRYIEVVDERTKLHDAVAEARSRASALTKPTHYQSWTRGALPYDRDTYTELLFKLPTNNLTHEESNRLATLHDKALRQLGETGMEPSELAMTLHARSALTPEEGEEYVRLLNKEQEQQDIKYNSGHFPGQGENLLAHGRFSVTEIDGKKYLQAMELQSDWHQAAHDIRTDEVDRIMKEAKDKGQPITKGEAEKLVPQDFGWESARKTVRPQDVILSDMIARSREILKDHGFDNNEIYERVASSNEKARIDGILDADPKIAELQKELHAASEERRLNRVADAPLKDVWHEFVMKALIREAAARGLDGIILNGGKVNDERYRFGEMGVSKLEYDPKTMELTAYDRDGDPHEKADHIFVRPENLHQYIGRGVAEKLLETPVKKFSDIHGELIGEPPVGESQLHVLKDEGLVVKNPGMYFNYDEKLPNFLNKYVSRLGWDKMGVKGVEKIERDVAAEKKKAEEESGQIVYMPEADGKVEGDPDIHWKLDFPEKVVENIKTKGQPLYDLGAKGDKGVSASEPLPEGQSPFGHMTDEELIAAYKKLAFETEDMTRTAIKETEKERRDSIAEIISNFGKANLLSALGVHGTNLASNTLYAAFKISTEPVAAIIDMITAPYYKDPVTGKGMRTAVFGAGAGEFKAWKQAWLSAKGIDPNLEGKDLEKAILNQGGWNRAWKEMWNTQPDSIREKMEGFGSGQRLRENQKMPSDAGNLEKVSKHFLGGVQWYSDVLFRALAAEDALFNIWHVRRSLESQARAMEKNGEGKYEDLMNDPTQRMIDIAEYEGMQATFNHRNWTSTQWAKIRGYLLKFAEQHHASAIKAYHEGRPFITAAQGGTAMFGKMVYIAADQIAPFVQTPTNILMRGLDMTPVGFAKGVVKLAEAKMALNAGLNAQLVGKQTDPNAEFQSMYKDAAFSLKRQGVHLIGESIGGAAIAYGIIHAMNAGYQKILVPYISNKEREAARFSQMGGEGYGGNKLITPDIYVPFTGQVLLYSRTWDVSALGPPGAIIMAAGAYGKHIKEGPGWAAVAAGKALMLSMMNHPLIENTVDFYNWLSGDYEYTDKKGEVKEKPNMFAAGMGKRMIPLSGLAGNVAMMHDPFQRKQKTTLDAIHASIPGHGLSLGPLSFSGREDLDTKPSPLTGEPLENTRVPIFSTEKYTLNEPKNAVLKAVVTNRISPPTATPREGEKPEMAAKRKAMALKLFNEGVAKAIQSDKYKSLPDWDSSMEKRELGENESPKNKREYIMWFLKGLHMEKTMNELGFKPLKK